MRMTERRAMQLMVSLKALPPSKMRDLRNTALAHFVCKVLPYLPECNCGVELCGIRSTCPDPEAAAVSMVSNVLMLFASPRMFTFCQDHRQGLWCLLV